MATDKKVIEFSNRIKSIKSSDDPAVNHIVAGADDIYDDEKGKKQSEVNAETDATLAEHTSTINGLNSQNYVTVTATDQTTAVTDVLPATGEVATVYRVGNWDGSQYDETCYSEYSWNGSAYVHLSTKTQIGEVFDISAYHATGGTLATYADLSAALGTNGANIPESLRKGGMSVKYVQTDDNKYVRYDLAANDFTTDINEWMSYINNVVKSATSLSDIQKYLSVNYNTEGTSAGSRVGFDIDILANTTFNLITNPDYNVALHLYDKSGTILYDSNWVNSISNNELNLLDYPSYFKMRIYFRKADDSHCSVNDVITNALSDFSVGYVEQIKEQNNDIQIFNNIISYISYLESLWKNDHDVFSAEIAKIVKEIFGDTINLSNYIPVDGYILSGKWKDTSFSNRQHICIPLNDINVVTVFANANHISNVCFLSAYNVVENGSASTIGNIQTIPPAGMKVFSVPEGANYLYVQYNSSELIYLPSNIFANGMEEEIRKNKSDISHIFNSYLNTKKVKVQTLNVLQNYCLIEEYNPNRTGARVLFKNFNCSNLNVIVNNGYKVSVRLYNSNGQVVYDSYWQTAISSDGFLYNYQYDYIVLTFRKPDDSGTDLNDVIQNAVSTLSINCYTQEYNDYLDTSIIQKIFKSQKKLTVRNIAHQGYSTTSSYYGDNLAAGYIKAAEVGFDFGECDITFSSDGVPFCSHGIKVDNVWVDAFMDDNNEVVYFANNTAAQIKSHPYMGTTVSTFEEVIAACKSVGIGLYIDKISRIDTDTKWNTTFDIIKKYAMCENVVFMPTNLAKAQKVFSIYPSAKISIITSLASGITIANQVKTPYNDVRIDIDYSNNTVSQIADGYAQLNPGIGIDVYTIDNISKFKEYLPYVSGITSNKLCERIFY